MTPFRSLSALSLLLFANTSTGIHSLLLLQNVWEIDGCRFIVYPRRHESCCPSLATTCANTYNSKKNASLSSNPILPKMPRQLNPVFNGAE